MACPLGLPKIFRVSIFDGHTWVLSKSWMHTKFRVPRSTFYHIARSSKTYCLPLKMAAGGRPLASGNVVKRWPRDPKLGIHSDFGPNSRIELKNWAPKNLGSPVYTTALEYFLKSVTNLSRQIVQEGPKTETQLLQMIGRKSGLLHRTRIE